MGARRIIDVRHWNPPEPPCVSGFVQDNWHFLDRAGVEAYASAAHVSRPCVEPSRRCLEALSPGLATFLFFSPAIAHRRMNHRDGAPRLVGPCICERSASLIPKSQFGGEKRSVKLSVGLKGDVPQGHMDIGMRRNMPVSPSKDSDDHRDHDEDDRDGSSADESASRRHKFCQSPEDAVDPPWAAARGPLPATAPHAAGRARLHEKAVLTRSTATACDPLRVRRSLWTVAMHGADPTRAPPAHQGHRANHRHRRAIPASGPRGRVSPAVLWTVTRRARM